MIGRGVKGLYVWAKSGKKGDDKYHLSMIENVGETYTEFYDIVTDKHRRVHKRYCEYFENVELTKELVQGFGFEFSRYEEGEASYLGYENEIYIKEDCLLKLSYEQHPLYWDGLRVCLRQNWTLYKEQNTIGYCDYGTLQCEFGSFLNSYEDLLPIDNEVREGLIRTLSQIRYH